MAVLENDYAAYIQTEAGEYPLRDLGALRTYQREENAGKILTVGPDGIVTPVEMDETLTDDTKAAPAGVVGELKNGLSELEDNLIFTQNASLTLDVKTDGYYKKDGTFQSDVGRKYAIVSVNELETYEVTTWISSTSIAGIIFRNNEDVISYDLVGNGPNKQIENYKITIPNHCNNIIVQSANNTKVMSVDLVYSEYMESCDYTENKTVYIGEDIISNVNGYYVPNTGWSGDKSSGYTHTTGTASMSFSSNDIEKNQIYLCEFDTSFTEDEFVKVGLGQRSRILCYNGTSHITIPVLYDGTGEKALYFTPLNDVQFTVSNITLKKINGGNTEKILKVFNMLTNNHQHNYGFWNVFLGKNTAENAVGTTRSVAIGYASMNALQGGHRNVGVGTFTMSQMKKGENNVSIGADSMLAIKKANDCIAIGKGAMYNGELVEDNVAIGHYALTGSATSENSKRNVVVGKNAGWHCYGQNNTFMGYQAGYMCKNTNGNTCIGKNAYGGESGNHNTCIGEGTEFASGSNNSTAVGYGAKTTKSNQMVFGNGSVSEVVFCGNKKINFNTDGTVTWETI